VISNAFLNAGTERYPEATPRIISDNGPQFMAKEFKASIRIKGTDHVWKSPCYPQSNGKIERFHQNIKRECIRPQTPLDLDDAKRIIQKYVDCYNSERL
jgi:transposase InsO family protein